MIQSISQPKDDPEEVLNPFVDERMPDRLNACVGTNGWPGIDTYIDGYDDAAKLLGKAMVVDAGASVDALIYPFFFSARHRIELSIKALILTISKMVGRSNECSRLLIKHDLQILWDKYVELSADFDRRFLPLNKEIADAVIGFFVVDPTGQTFRYPFRAEDNARHLVDYSVINVGVVFRKYLMVAEWFDQVEDLTRSLSAEFRLGTRTSKLSRRDLFEIANILPDLKDWGKADFDVVKEKVKIDFGVGGTSLGSRDFSKALDLIQGHRELSAKIGKEIKITTIDYQTLVAFIGVKLRCERIPRGQYDEMRQAKGAALVFLEGVTDEAVATLMAFYSLGRDIGTYSEQYDDIYAEHLVSLRAHRIGHLNYLLSKKYFIRGMAEGMEMAGQSSLLDCMRSQGCYPPPIEALPDEEREDLGTQWPS